MITTDKIVYLIQVTTAEEVSSLISLTCNVRCRNVNIVQESDVKKVSFTLTWDYIVDQDRRLPKCFDIFCEGMCDPAIEFMHPVFGKFFGRAYADSYYISDMIVPTECMNNVVITVQSISFADVRQNINDCCRINLKW